MRTKFSEDYKTKIFQLWYNKGKPHTVVLYNMLPPTELGERPTQLNLGQWIKLDFRPRAEAIDAEVQKELQIRMVQEKVEMLSRHARMGKEMQDMGITYLKEHEKDLNAQVSLNLVVRGWEIEHASRGVSSALEKMLKMSDEDLQKEITLLLSSPENKVAYEAIDDEN